MRNPDFILKNKFFRMKKKLLFILLVPAFLFCACRPDADELVFNSGTADFSKPVVIGDNFLSGYQDGAFTREGQSRSVGNLLLGQFKYMNEAAAQTEYASWLNYGSSIGWNSKPWESWYNTASKLGDRTDCEGVVSLGPVKQLLSVSDAQNIIIPQNNYSGPQNYSVPFATTADLFNASLGSNPFADNHNPFYFPIASQPGTSTIASDVLAAQKTFFTVWLGMENIYSFARNGGTGPAMISQNTFAGHLDSLLAPMTNAGAKGVIANIPDFRVFPYYTLIPWNGAELTQSKADSLNDIYAVSGLTHIVFHEGKNGFVINDPAAPFGVRQMHSGEYITLSVPLDSMKCNFMGILFSTIPDRYVLDSSEVAEIDAAVAAYNSVIAQKANQYGLAVADMHSYFNSVYSGIRWDGVDMNAEFVSGGFFSLDGYHPHQKGYALITNEFIKAINQKFGSNVPTVNCFDCDGVLFP